MICLEISIFKFGTSKHTGIKGTIATMLRAKDLVCKIKIRVRGLRKYLDIKYMGIRK